MYNAYIDMLTWDDAEPYPEVNFRQSVLHSSLTYSYISEPTRALRSCFIDSLLFLQTLFLEEERLRRLKLDYFRLSVSCTLLFLSLGLIPQSLHKDDFKESIKSFIMILMVEAKNDA